MRKAKFILVFVLLALLLGAGLGATIAEEPNPQTLPSADWTTFTHPELGFSFSYPVDWHLENDLSLAEPSGTVSIASIDPKVLESGYSDVLARRQIHIGLHLVEWSEPITTRAWVNAYDEAASKLIGHRNTQVIEIVGMSVDGYPAVRKIATSPLLTYDAVTIKRGNVMWFIWSNDEPYHPETFEHIVRTFRWDNAELPLTLEDLGIEPTARLDSSEKTLTPPSKSQTDESAAKTSSIVPKGRLLGAPSGYIIPFNGTYYITAGPGPNCGSPYHTGNALRAIDYGLPMYTAVYAASNGTMYFNGWDNSGYGNLIGVLDGSNRIAWYAHLSIRTGLSVGANVFQWMCLGFSGDTGIGTGPHLHFHVRTTGGVPVDIRDVPHTIWDNDELTWNNGLCSGSLGDSRAYR